MTAHEQKNDDPNHALITELKKLRGEMRELNSWRRRFLLGVLTGFGTVVGATVVVATVVFVLTKLASIETLRPFIENIVHIVQERTSR